MPPSPLLRNVSRTHWRGPCRPANALPQEGGCLAFSPDGTLLIAGAEFTAMIAVWRVSDGRLLRQFGPDAAERLSALAVTPDGRQILSGGNRMVANLGTTATIRFWDIETGNCLQDLSGSGEEQGLGNVALYLPTAGQLRLSISRGVRILETATGRLRQTSICPGRPNWQRQPCLLSPMGGSSLCRTRTRSRSSRQPPADGCTMTPARPSVCWYLQRGRRREIGLSPDTTTGSCELGTP